MGCVPFRRKENISPITNNSSNLSKKEETNATKFLYSEKIKIERGLFVQSFSTNPYEKYEIISQLGEGSYGKVYKVKEKGTDIFRAMKIVKKRFSYDNPEEEKRIKKEMQILKKLDHPNIIKVFEFYNDKSEFFIISEICEGGELFDKIVKLKKFTERNAANVMKQILSAIQFCHKNQIIHRDLKPENILIEDKDINNSNFCLIKVIDFGTAEIFKKNTLLSKQIGTPYYIAPEVLNNLYNEKCDMWSCGVIMYILLCGFPPFYGKNDQEIYNSIKSGRFTFKNVIWNSVSVYAKNLIKKLLNVDFTKRPTAEEAIRDPWFSIFSDGNIYSLNECTNFKNTMTSDNNSKGEKLKELGLKEALYNLKNFRAERKLQLATLYFMVHTLVEKEDVQIIRDIFNKFDLDKDGRLTKEEIEQGFKKAKYLDCSEKEINKLMDVADIDGNGYIEYQEFIAATYSKQKILSEINLRKAFDMFDNDKDEKISSDELKLILGVGNEENDIVWSKIISEIDSDGDGVISFDEFKTMMYNLISSA